MHESSTGSKIPICFCVYFRLGKVPCFTNNATPVRHWKHLIWHSMTTALSVSSSSCVYGGGGLHSFCVYVCVCVHVCAGICVCVCVCARYQWPSDPLPSKISLSPLHHLYCLWDVLMCESKFYWIICGLQRYMGWCWSVQVFVFSSEAASVANVS